jgi:hypothetical protein
MRLKGTINNLAINSQMTIANGGYVDVRGTMDLLSKDTGYNLDFTTRDLNLNTVVAKMPSTDLTATGSAKGRGFNPATMQAQLVAGVGASRIDTVNIDSANVRVAIANGLARIDTLAVDLPMSLHLHSMPDDPTLNAVMYGPLVLAGRLGTSGLTPATLRAEPTKPREVPEYRLDPVPAPAFAVASDDPAQWIKPTGTSLEFRTQGQAQDVEFVPFYRIFDERYAIYWKVTRV